MKRTLALLSLGLLGAAMAPAGASAQTYPAPRSCANVQRSSWYGTVEAVNNGYITVKTNSGEGWVHVYTANAHVNYNGQQLRPGVYAGIFGCDIESRGALVAEDITLSDSASTYPRNYRYGGNGYTTIQGQVVAIRSGEFLVQTNSGHGKVWVYGNVNGLRNGETIRATGRFNSNDRSFSASSVTIE